MVVPAVIVVAIFLGFAAVVETPATTTPAWKIERLKPEPNTPYIAQGSLSPIYPATPGKELLGKPMAMAVRAPNTLHEAVTAKRIDMRQALQIHKLPRQIYAAGEEHQSYSQQSYGYDPKLECNVMRKLSAVAFVVMMITGPPSAIAYTQEDADACTPDAMRLCQ